MDALAAPLAIDFRRRVFNLDTPNGPGDIAAIEFGDSARPVDVIFVHANGFNALTYRSILAPMADRLHILAIDQQGHGRSPQRVASEDRSSWILFRDDLVALLDQIGGGPLLLSGHSMGGTASVLASALRPERVKGLALFDPVMMAPEMLRRASASEGPALSESPLAIGAAKRRAVFASRQEAFGRYKGRGAFTTWPDEVLTDYLEDGFRDRADGEVELSCAPSWEAANFSSHQHDPWGPLHAVRAPVTILRASEGSTCSADSAEPFVADNPAFKVQTIPGTTHFLPIQRPDLVRKTILAMA
jgi:pimeloyl-ACP methyl ester carboxylesterase